jgi:hypothetical protein
MEPNRANRRKIWDALEDIPSRWKEMIVDRSSTAKDTVPDRRDTVRNGGNQPGEPLSSQEPLIPIKERLAKEE